MPNQIILSMSKIYPFGACQRPEKKNNEILVRKQIITGNKDEYIFRAKLIKKLRVPYSIQIRSIFQEGQSLEVYYEYVPLKFEIWMKNMSDQVSDNLSKQLYKLTTYLADNKISTEFNGQGLGLDKNYHIKYFIDIQKTFYNENQNSSTLKQKYYREINKFIKSINFFNDKNQNNPLFYSLNNQRSCQISIKHSSLKALNKNFNKTFSLQNFKQKYVKNINLTQDSNVAQSIKLRQGQNIKECENLTQSSEVEITQNHQNIKQSASNKSYKINCHSKLKSIQNFINTTKNSHIQFQSCRFQPNKSVIKNSYQLNKSKIQKPNPQSSKRGVSIDKLVSKKQGAKEITELSNKSKCKKESQSQRSSFDGNSSFSKPQYTKNKSQRFKTPKNSQSPIEYLDIVKSSSQYVQDFLNVLQDSFQQENNSFQQNKQQITQQNEQNKICQNGSQQQNINKRLQDENIASQIGKKGQLKTQQSQNENENQDVKWRVRFEAVIQNSKKLIDRMKSPTRGLQNILKM